MIFDYANQQNVPTYLIYIMKVIKWLFIWASSFFLIYMLLIAKWSGAFNADESAPLSSYYYHVSKYELEKAVFAVLSNNKNILHTRTDSNQHFNDGINYLTLKIKNSNPHIEYEYITSYNTRKYNGDDSNNSEISIPHAHVNNADFRKNERLKSTLIHLIEKELINKVDSILDGKRM